MKAGRGIRGPFGTVPVEARGMSISWSEVLDFEISFWRQ